VKIGDFGFTKRLNSQQGSLKVNRVTHPRWVAPEVSWGSCPWGWGGAGRGGAGDALCLLVRCITLLVGLAICHVLSCDVLLPAGKYWGHAAVLNLQLCCVDWH